MKYNITQHDKDLLLQKDIQYQYKLLVIDRNKSVIDELSGLQTIGSYCVDSASDTRRTASFTMYLNNSYREDSVEKKLYEWIGFRFLLQIGIYSIREDAFQWYDCGCYLITEGSASYNSTDNSITVSLYDQYSQLNGTRNGQIGGAPTIEIANTDAEGQPVTIKQATEGLLKSETDITDYIVDDIGQFSGMPQNNPQDDQNGSGYEQYREEHPLWNQLPYDLEYEAGCTVADILSEINNLYPNCQMYFDIYGNFCFNMVPSCENDPIILDDSYMQSILTSESSESVSYDIESIKNVTEVFGNNYAIDRLSESCTTSENIYTVTLDDYEAYSSDEMIAFIPSTDNIENMQIRINSLDALPLCSEYTENSIDAGLLKSGKTYVVKIKKVNGEYTAYYLGQYQPHALCVLTDNLNDGKYTKAYFSQKYNCAKENIKLRLEENSPFSVQKLGEILDVKSGDEFENIDSDSGALSSAIYYNQMSSSVNDTVTLSVEMIPFLDVNTKIEYRKQQEAEPHDYIVKSITNNTDTKTSSIVMYRFYPLYHA